MNTRLEVPTTGELLRPPIPSRPPIRKGVLIYNPTAGQRDRRPQMDALIGRMRAGGITLVNAPTMGPGHATAIVRAFLPLKPDVIAVCGGDGTVSEVARGLSGSGIPLAMLPGGTSNVLARELGIPLDPERAGELLWNGRLRSVRVLLANDRPFLLWAGTGLDARVMGHMSLALKRRLGRSGIFFTAASEFLRYEFPRLAVRIDGADHEATFAVVCHARHYGGDWVIAPEASLDSEEMDVLLFARRNHWDLFRLFLAIKRGRSAHLARGLARVVRGRLVEIRSRETYPVEVHADGDCVLETPVTCRATADTVEVLVPA
ncbi:MAG: diacylglycerol/lipid kinase family protein [Acidobacteriota bacterium]